MTQKHFINIYEDLIDLVIGDETHMLRLLPVEFKESLVIEHIITIPKIYKAVTIINRTNQNIFIKFNEERIILQGSNSKDSLQSPRVVLQYPTRLEFTIIDKEKHIIEYNEYSSKWHFREHNFKCLASYINGDMQLL